MEQDNAHEIDLYLLEVFRTLLDHEVRKSRRYKYPLSLVCIALEAEPDTPQTRYAAEMVAINTLDVELRDTDVPCRDGHEFMVLMPSTDEKGAHNACERLERALNTSDQTSSGDVYQMSAYIGLASMEQGLPLSPKQLIGNARSAMNSALENRSLAIALFSGLKRTGPTQE